MITNWGEFNFVGVDNIQLNDDMIELTNLICVPRETIHIETPAGKFQGVFSTGNPYVVFPLIRSTISDALQRFPEIREMISVAIESISNEEEKEESVEDEDYSGDFTERY